MDTPPPAHTYVLGGCPHAIQTRIALGHPLALQWCPTARRVITLEWAVIIGVLALGNHLLTRHLDLSLGLLIAFAALVRTIQLYRQTFGQLSSSQIARDRLDHLHVFMAYLEPLLVPDQAFGVYTVPPTTTPLDAHRRFEIHQADLGDGLNIGVHWFFDTNTQRWQLRARLDVPTNMTLSPSWPADLATEPDLSVIDLAFAQWGRQQWVLTFAVPDASPNHVQQAARVLALFATDAVYACRTPLAPAATQVRIVDGHPEVWPQPQHTTQPLRRVGHPVVGGPHDLNLSARRAARRALLDLPIFIILVLGPLVWWSRTHLGLWTMLVTVMLWTVCGLMVSAFYDGFFPWRPWRRWQALQTPRYHLDGPRLYKDSQPIIDLTEPFTLTLSRASDLPLLHVSLRSAADAQRVAWTVAVVEDDTFRALPALDVQGPQLNAFDVVTWLWPTIQFYASAHGTGNDMALRLA